MPELDLNLALVTARRAVEAAARASLSHFILVEEAGGRFTNFTICGAVASGNCVVSNGALHEHVLEILRGGDANRQGAF